MGWLIVGIIGYGLAMLLIAFLLFRWQRCAVEAAIHSHRSSKR
jgi:hypothetical protein